MLGKVTKTAELVRRVRGLLNANSPGVRVAAYQALDRLGDVTNEADADTGQVARRAGSIFRMRVGDQFILDIVDAKESPVIWASRTGTPRIAVIGDRPRLRAPMMFTGFGDRLTISVDKPNGAAQLFYRPVTARATAAKVFPEVIELVARLGGERPPGELGIYLTYGDVLAVIKKLSDDGQLLTVAGNRVPFVLQDVAGDAVQDAPIIPGLEKLSGGVPTLAQATADAAAVTPAATPTAPPKTLLPFATPVPAPSPASAPGAPRDDSGLSAANP